MPDTGVERRLTVIFAADVVGFSRLMEADEESTVQALNTYRKSIDDSISRHQGRVFGSAGDSVIAEFSSPIEAVRCAVNIQESLSADGERNPGMPVLRYRIGINLGDVIVDGDNLLGDGVNIASRLESIANPGGIALSQSVHEHVKKHFDFEFADWGEQSLKNISEPVRVFTLSLGGNFEVSNEDRNSAPLPGFAGKPSLAVLPFTNLSGDAEQEYFSDGVTEDIIAALSNSRTFPVISRNSSFAYKGQAVRIQQVAKDLGARYILEGSIRKSGDRIRITAQLSDAESGHQVWAGKFDDLLDDVFEVQDKITLKIVTTIQPELALVEIEKSKTKRPNNLSAWDLVLKGMYLVNRHTREEFVLAQEIFEKAIALDPDYSDAWTGLGWSYLRRIELHDSDQRQELLELGMKASKKAVELDENSSMAHYVLGLSYVWAEDLKTALSEVQIALELNPFNAQARRGLGNRLDLIGRTPEGISAMEQALQLSPRDPNCPKLMGYLCRAYIDDNQPEKALIWIEKAIALQPENPDLHFRKAACLAHLDRVEEAQDSLQASEQLKPGFLIERQNWSPYSDAKRNENFFAGLSRHSLLNQ